MPRTLLLIFICLSIAAFSGKAYSEQNNTTFKETTDFIQKKLYSNGNISVTVEENRDDYFNVTSVVYSIREVKFDDCTFQYRYSYKYKFKEESDTKNYTHHTLGKIDDIKIKTIDWQTVLSGTRTLDQRYWYIIKHDNDENLMVRNEDDARKIVKAFKYANRLCGAKDDPF